MAKKIAVSILSLLTLLASCKDRDTYRYLQNVEQVIETDVPAANSMLSSIQLSDNKRNRALYAILKTQVDYKSNIVAQDDSLILTAVNYYANRYGVKKDYHAAMAWYSLGCVYTDMGNDVQAINAYLKALNRMAAYERKHSDEAAPIRATEV